MLAKERQNRILAIIRENNSIRMADIIKEFHVSHETARRDLDALQDQNLIMRVHGGAILAERKPLLQVWQAGQIRQISHPLSPAAAPRAQPFFRSLLRPQLCSHPERPPAWPREQP